MHPSAIFIFALVMAIIVVGKFVLPALLPWWRARAAGVPITLKEISLMILCRIDPDVIVRACIVTRKAGLEIQAAQFESMYLAQGHVAALAEGLIAAKQAGIALDFDRACAIDLAGRDVVAAVQGAIKARVIAVPAVQGVALDGVAVAVAASATVRTCLERLVGGATEATVVARIGHAIVEEVAALADHRAVDADRAGLADRVFARDIARNCALSIDRIVITGVTVIGPVAEELIARRRAELAAGAEPLPLVPDVPRLKDEGLLAE